MRWMFTTVHGYWNRHGNGQEAGVYLRSTSPGSHWCGCSPLPTRLSIKRYRPPTPVSVAAAGPHHHVLVFLQYDVGVVVEVEHGDGVELGGGAARLRYVLGVHQVHLKGKGNT